MIGSAVEPESLTRTDSVLEGQGVRVERRIAGFTSSTVTVPFGSIIYTYGEEGRTVYAKAVGGSPDHPDHHPVRIVSLDRWPWHARHRQACHPIRSLNRGG